MRMKLSSAPLIDFLPDFLAILVLLGVLRHHLLLFVLLGHVVPYRLPLPERWLQ